MIQQLSTFSKAFAANKRNETTSMHRLTDLRILYSGYSDRARGTAIINFRKHGLGALAARLVGPSSKLLHF